MPNPQQGLEAAAALAKAKRRDDIARAIDDVRRAMHVAEGTIDPGEHQAHVWNSQYMGLAATHLELVGFYAMKATE